MKKLIIYAEEENWHLAIWAAKKCQYGIYVFGDSGKEVAFLVGRLTSGTVTVRQEQKEPESVIDRPSESNAGAKSLTEKSNQPAAQAECYSTKTTT